MCGSGGGCRGGGGGEGVWATFSSGAALHKGDVWPARRQEGLLIGGPLVWLESKMARGKHSS